MHNVLLNGLLRTMDLGRCIRPAAAAFKRLDIPIDHPPIVQPRLVQRISGQEWGDLHIMPSVIQE